MPWIVQLQCEEMTPALAKSLSRYFKFWPGVDAVTAVIEYRKVDREAPLVSTLARWRGAGAASKESLIQELLLFMRSEPGVKIHLDTLELRPGDPLKDDWLKRWV